MISFASWSPFCDPHPSQMSFGPEGWQGNDSGLANRQGGPFGWFGGPSHSHFQPSQPLQRSLQTLEPSANRAGPSPQQAGPSSDNSRPTKRRRISPTGRLRTSLEKIIGAPKTPCSYCGDRKHKLQSCPRRRADRLRDGALAISAPQDDPQPKKTAASRFFEELSERSRKAMELSPNETALLARRASCIPAVVQKLKLQDEKLPAASLRA